MITARNTEIGALIDSGSNAKELFHIAAVHKLRVFVNVPEVYSRAAQPGIAAALTLKEFPGRTFTGTLARTAQAIDVASRTLLTEIDVDNAKGELLPGSYAEVHLKLPTPTSTLKLPVNALIFKTDGLQVATVTATASRSLPSRVGRDFGNEVEIVSGLTGNERIVVNPPDSLADGATVRVARGWPGSMIAARELALRARRHCAVPRCCRRARRKSSTRRPPRRRRPRSRKTPNWKPAEPADAALRGDWWELFGDAQLNALEVADRDLEPDAARRGGAVRRGARGGERRARRALSAGRRRAVGRARSSSPATARSRRFTTATPISWCRRPCRTSPISGDGCTARSRRTARWRRRPPPISRRRASASTRSWRVDYFSLRGLDRERELLESAVTAYERALELTRNRFSGGLASQADVALAETQLETTRAQSVDIGVARAALEHAIAVLDRPVAVDICARRRAARERAAGRCRPACRRSFSSGVPTSRRPNAASRRPTPRSASRRARTIRSSS